VGRPQPRPLVQVRRLRQRLQSQGICKSFSDPSVHRLGSAPGKSLVTFCTDIAPQQHLSLLCLQQDLFLPACWKLKIPELLAAPDGIGRLPHPGSWWRQMDGVAVSYFCSSAGSWSSLCCFCMEATVPALPGAVVAQLSPAHPSACPPFSPTCCKGPYCSEVKKLGKV